MPSYLSTFPAGLVDAIESALRRSLGDLDVVHRTESLIVYATRVPIATIRKQRFLNNTFLVLGSYRIGERNQVESLLERVLQDNHLSDAIRRSVRPGEDSFRVMTQHAGATVPVDRDLMGKLEQRLGRLTGARVNRRHPHIEYWLISRREGDGFFTKRLTRHASYDKILQQGELRPELAAILCELSEPSPNDVFLDPFCGSGAIPIQRKALPYRAIFASDRDDAKVKQLRSQFKSILKSRTNRFNIRHDDALSLTRYEPGFVTKIVTDPPWGVSDALETDKQSYYKLMMETFYLILANDGIVVVLVGPKDSFEAALNGLSGKYEILERYDILVSGQKAAIFKMRKSN